MSKLSDFIQYVEDRLEPFTLDDDKLLNEKHKDIRVRDGKKETKYVSDKEGYKMKDGVEVKMSGKEIANRKRGQKAGQMKRNAKMGQIKKRIEKGKNKAERLGLDIGRPEE